MKTRRARKPTTLSQMWTLLSAISRNWYRCRRDDWKRNRWLSKRGRRSNGSRKNWKIRFSNRPKNTNRSRCRGKSRKRRVNLKRIRRSNRPPRKLRTSLRKVTQSSMKNKRSRTNNWRNTTETGSLPFCTPFKTRSKTNKSSNRKKSRRKSAGGRNSVTRCSKVPRLRHVCSRRRKLTMKRVIRRHLTRAVSNLLVMASRQKQGSRCLYKQEGLHMLNWATHRAPLTRLLSRHRTSIPKAKQSTQSLANQLNALWHHHTATSAQSP